MANDRLILKDAITGKQILIAKHFLGEWQVFYDDLSEKLDIFFDETFTKDGRGVYFLTTEFCEYDFLTFQDKVSEFYYLVNKLSKQLI